MCLKKSLVILLLLLLVLPLYSQDLQSASDEELLTELSTIFDSLEKDNNGLKILLGQMQTELTDSEIRLTERQELLRQMESQLAEQKILYQNLEKEKLTAVILSAIISGVVCGGIGLIYGLAR